VNKKKGEVVTVFGKRGATSEPRRGDFQYLYYVSPKGKLRPGSIGAKEGQRKKNFLNKGNWDSRNKTSTGTLVGVESSDTSYT